MRRIVVILLAVSAACSRSGAGRQDSLPPIDTLKAAPGDSGRDSLRDIALPPANVPQLDTVSRKKKPS